MMRLISPARFAAGPVKRQVSFVSAADSFIAYKAIFYCLLEPQYRNIKNG